MKVAVAAFLFTERDVEIDHRLKNKGKVKEQGKC